MEPISLEVLVISDGVRETACTNCIHHIICKHKEEYLNAIEALYNASISFDHDGKIATKKVTNVECISSIEVLCKFFYEDELKYRV